MKSPEQKPVKTNMLEQIKEVIAQNQDLLKRVQKLEDKLEEYKRGQRDSFEELNERLGRNNID